MNEFTPTTGGVRGHYAGSRLDGDGVDYGYAISEFDRWLAAHDQGVRDAVKPPELTAKEHMEAAFEAAYPVPKCRGVPPGVPIIARWEDGEIWANATGSTAQTAVTNDNAEIRTLDPLPPLIPDDCNAVWASTRDDESRRVWVRATGFMAGLEDEWDDGNRDADYAEPSDLINPVPIPEESE